MPSGKPCQHLRLQFQSGDYYVACMDCERKWVTINPEQPEYGINLKGEKVGADPALANHGFEGSSPAKCVRISTIF